MERTTYKHSLQMGKERQYRLKRYLVVLETMRRPSFFAFQVAKTAQLATTTNQAIHAVLFAQLLTKPTLILTPKHVNHAHSPAHIALNQEPIAIIVIPGIITVLTMKPAILLVR